MAARPGIYIAPEQLAQMQTDPLFAASVLCPNELIPPHQAITLKGFFSAENSFSSSGRSTGKTHASALFAILWAVTHPGTKVLVLAQKFRSGQQVLEAVESIVERNAELMKCVNLNARKRVLTRGSAEWLLELKNGSKLITVPSDMSRKGERVRGLRCNVLILDEFATLDIKTVESVFLPCASIRIGGLRRVVLTTTGGFKPGGNWDYCKRHYDEHKAGNPDYFFCNFCYEDIPPEHEHIVDHKAIQQYLDDSDPDTVAREVYGKWTQRGSTFIPQAVLEYNRLRASEQDIFPEREAEPGCTYVLGCDFGFSGADETSVAVLKKLRSGKWAVVNSTALNTKKGWAEKNAELVFEFMCRFKPVFVGMDRAGGEQVLNKLKEYYDDPADCPIAIDDEDLSLPGRRVVRVFTPTGVGKDNNTRLNSVLLQYLDGNGSPRLLIPLESNTDDWLAVEDLDTLCYQMTLVQATNTTNEGFFKFSSSSKKDRYSALLYGINAAVELIDSFDVDRNEIPEDDHGVATWIPNVISRHGGTSDIVFRSFE